MKIQVNTSYTVEQRGLIDVDKLESIEGVTVDLDKRKLYKTVNIDLEVKFGKLTADEKTALALKMYVIRTQDAIRNDLKAEAGLVIGESSELKELKNTLKADAELLKKVQAYVDEEQKLKK